MGCTDIEGYEHRTIEFLVAVGTVPVRADTAARTRNKWACVRQVSLCEVEEADLRDTIEPVQAFRAKMYAALLQRPPAQPAASPQNSPGCTAPGVSS